MKIYVTMKCPDALDMAIQEAVEENGYGADNDDELNEMMEEARIEARKIAEKWFRWGETVTLVIDTNDKTCVVREA